MEEYLGKFVKISTENGSIKAKLCSVDVDNGNIVVENESNKQELKFTDVTAVSLVEDDNTPQPISEEDMYSLFYESFNIFGPFEDQFIYNIACSFRKFLKEISTATIKIIVGSDDVFGRIGLCFARLMWNRALKVSVELKCELNELSSLKYKSSFENCGGFFEKPQGGDNSFTMVLFATNRNFEFNSENFTSNHILIIDIPKNLSLPNFTVVGLGFIPENYNLCTKIYYIIDVGFGEILAKRYKLPTIFKTSLIKMDVNNKVL